MPLPPGIFYLAKQLPRILAPPLVVYGSKLVAELRFGIAVSTWFTAIACVLSGPALFTVIVQYRDYQIRCQAAAHGAVMAPNLSGSVIGGILRFFANTENIYPGKLLPESRVEPLTQTFVGEGLAVLGQEIGYTFTLRFLGQNSVRGQQELAR
jgi:hypothetical protein